MTAISSTLPRSTARPSPRGRLPSRRSPSTARGSSTSRITTSRRRPGGTIPFSRALSAALSFSFSPYLWCNDVDDHVFRLITFYTTMRGGVLLEPRASMTFSPTPRIGVHAGRHVPAHRAAHRRKLGGRAGNGGILIRGPDSPGSAVRGTPQMAAAPRWTRERSPSPSISPCERPQGLRDPRGPSSPIRSGERRQAPRVARQLPMKARPGPARRR